MPVPVTPQKTPTLIPTSPSPDDVTEHRSISSDEVDAAGVVEGSQLQQVGADEADPCVVAGYEDCLRETMRFLVQEEKLPSDHPLVAGLNFHLTRDTAHQELLRVSSQLAERLNHEDSLSLSQSSDEDFDDSGLDCSLSDEEELPCVDAYQLTLVEDDTQDEDLEMDEQEHEDNQISAKDILANSYLRNELIRLVFQGCDLVVSPVPSV